MMQIPLWQERLTTDGQKARQLHWTYNDWSEWMIDLGMTVMIRTPHVVMLKQAYVIHVFRISWLELNLWIRLSKILREKWPRFSKLVARTCFITSFQALFGSRTLLSPLSINLVVNEIFFVISLQVYRNKTFLSSLFVNHMAAETFFITSF
jgi:hypothetical protein